MKIYGNVIAKGELLSGMSANGEWERQTLVIRPLDESERVIPIEFFGKKRVRDLRNVNFDDIVQVSFNINGREYEGRWFATIDGISCQRYTRATGTDPAENSAVIEPASQES